MMTSPLIDIGRYFRASSRLGAFIKASKAGMPADLARAYSDAVYPPTQRQMEFEKRLSAGQYHLPWGSALGILVVVAGIYSMVAQATAEEGIAPSLITTIGFGTAQFGYVLLAFGVVKGRFAILGLYKRWMVLTSAIVALVFGTILVNGDIWLKVI